MRIALSSPRHLTWPATALVALLSATPLLSQSSTTNKTQPVRYSALAIRTVGYTATVPVDITIQRWTTDEENEQVITALMEKGQNGLLEAIRGQREIGRLSSPGTVGFGLYYARRVLREDGGETVTIITERDMGFWETSQQTRSTRYPFTMIELDVNARGEGRGRLIVAARITYNKIAKQLTIENFEDSPVQLGGLKRAK
jgi:hypothetical protein